MEDDGLLVGELGEEGLEGVLEGRGGDVDGRLDAASDVVFFFCPRVLVERLRGMWGRKL